MANDKSKDKLISEIVGLITKAMEKTLDDAQMACPVKDTYKVLRSRILRANNDCMRNVKKAITNHYEVKYIPATEEIIEIRRPKIIKK